MISLNKISLLLCLFVCVHLCGGFGDGGGGCGCVFVIVYLCWRDWLQISDALQQSYATSALWRFLSLGYALMLCPFIIVLGGMFFLATALFFLDDREKAEKQ